MIFHQASTGSSGHFGPPNGRNPAKIPESNFKIRAHNGLLAIAPDGIGQFVCLIFGEMMMLRLSRLSLVTALTAVAAMSNAFTMATFADPALDGSTPLFTISGTSSMSAGWSGTGLLLQTPGWTGPDIPNAQFSMAPVALTGPDGNGFDTGAGTIHFTDSANAWVLDVTFNSGFVNILGFGGNTFLGSGVVFSGPGVPSGLTSTSFSFSFANQEQVGNDITTTASFTSSAVPEPVSVIALALGFAGLIARRRRA